MLFPVYQVGSEAGWSELFSFTSMQTGVNWSPRLAVYGDMGSENAQSLPRLVSRFPAKLEFQGVSISVL